MDLCIGFLLFLGVSALFFAVSTEGLTLSLIDYVASYLGLAVLSLGPFLLSKVFWKRVLQRDSTLIDELLHPRLSLSAFLIIWGIGITMLLAGLGLSRA